METLLAPVAKIPAESGMGRAGAAERWEKLANIVEHTPDALARSMQLDFPQKKIANAIRKISDVLRNAQSNTIKISKEDLLHVRENIGKLEIAAWEYKEIEKNSLTRAHRLSTNYVPTSVQIKTFVAEYKAAWKTLAKDNPPYTAEDMPTTRKRLKPRGTWKLYKGL